MFVTIEPSGDSDDIPSETRLMGGLFVDGQAALRAADVEGIEDELILAVGSYIVDTPTDGPSTNETSGIWFVNLTGGPPARGLRVAIPIQGWQYQGWAEFDGIAVDMGVITHHSRPDESSKLQWSTHSGITILERISWSMRPEGLIFPVLSRKREGLCHAGADGRPRSGAIPIRPVRGTCSNCACTGRNL